MALSLYADATTEAMTLATAKSWLRVDWGDDNTLIEAVLSAATRYVQAITWRALVSQTWDMKLNCFPDSDMPIIVPRPPLSSVTSITYTDTAGASQTLSASLYTVRTAPDPGEIWPAYNESWPSTRDHVDVVTVRFVAGYGALSAVPTPIVQAIKLLMAHLYDHRGDEPDSKVADACWMLLEPYRVRDGRVLEYVA